MPRSTKSSKSTKSTKATKKAEPTPEPTPVVNEVVQETEPTVDELGDRFTTVLEQLVGLKSLVGALTKEVRELKKTTDREIRKATKGRRRRPANPNRKPSGFVMPTAISPALAAFLGKPKGTEMARTEVTSGIHKYIKDNNLQNPKNRRQIFPDTKLAKLLGIKSTDELHYFNLQKHLAAHFPKKE